MVLDCDYSRRTVGRASSAWLVFIPNPKLAANSRMGELVQWSVMECFHGTGLLRRFPVFVVDGTEAILASSTDRECRLRRRCMLRTVLCAAKYEHRDNQIPVVRQSNLSSFRVYDWHDVWKDLLGNF